MTNSEAFVPPSCIVPITRSVLPVLEMVKVWGADEFPELNPKFFDSSDGAIFG